VRDLLTKLPSRAGMACRSRRSVCTDQRAVSERPHRTVSDIGAVVGADRGAVSLGAVYDGVAAASPRDATLSRRDARAALPIAAVSACILSLEGDVDGIERRAQAAAATIVTEPAQHPWGCTGALA
jgi:hypothetical protein